MQQPVEQVLAGLAPRRQAAGVVTARLQALLHRLADAHVLVLHDDPGARVSLRNAFGTLITDAVRLETGTASPRVWIEPPLPEWQEAGVWERLHRVLLERLQAAGQIDWSRAIVDSSSIRAVGAGGKNRAESHRSSPSRQQAPSHRGRRGRPAARHPHRR